MLPENAIIEATTESDANCLMKFLADNGVQWNGSRKLVGHNHWGVYGPLTCYRLRRASLTYGDKGYYQRFTDAKAFEGWCMISADEFITRCTAEEREVELTAQNLEEIL